MEEVNTITQQGRTIIRFGIMCNGLHFRQWQANAIKALLEHKRIECRLLLFDKRNSSGTTINNIIRFIKNKNILWRGYNRFSRNKFKAMKLVDLSSILADIPNLECQIIKKGKFSEYFSDSDISEIKKYNLDFILRFGFGIIRGDILNTAKYGVWSFHHDDEEKYRGGPPCFWEIYHNDKITGSILQRLTNNLDAGIILKKGFLKTKYSYVKNIDQMFFESSRWPTQVCADILNGNIDYFGNEPSATKAPIYYAPTNFQFIIFFLKSNVKKIQKLFNRLAFIPYWNIGVVNVPIHLFLNENSRSPAKWFPNLPKDRFFADPFAFVEGNMFRIFYEDYSYKEGKGNIAYTCYENGHFSIPKTVINEAFHLSYPYLLKIKGGIYMVPESCQANKVILYKAIDFPLIWKREQVLIDNYAGVDNTLFEYKGTWWMFTSDKSDGVSHNLKLFYADDIFGEWQPHPQNPVITDVRSARSAGTPFVYNGELYRPSMDYSEKIEGGITINKVITITKEIYREVKHNEVRPYMSSLFSDKIHTLVESGTEYTMIDGCRETFILTNINFIKFQFSSIFNN